MPIVSTLIPEFISFIKTLVLDPKNFNEIELSFFDIPLTTLGNINYYALNKVINIEKKTYFNVTKKTQTERFRQRVEFEDFKFYHMENREVKKNLTSLWEVKRRIVDQKLNDKIMMSHSVEYQKKDEISYISDNAGYLNLDFIRDLRFYTKNLKVEMRVTENLGKLLSSKRELLNRYRMYDNVFGKNPYVLKAEIELLDTKNINEDSFFLELEEELNQVLIILFGYKDLNKISIYRSQNESYKSNIKTVVEYPKTAISTYTLDSIVLTPKKDGEAIDFIIQEGKIQINFFNKRILFSINIDPEYYIKGMGEYLNRELYLFEVQEIKNLKTSEEIKINERLSSLKFVESLINEEESEVKLVKNLYIDNFTDSYLDLIFAINRIQTTRFDYEIDGVILFNKYLIKDAVDFKLKTDHTIDILFVLDVINGILQINNENKRELKFNLFVFNGTKFQEYDTYSIETSPDFYYDSDLNMLVVEKFKLVPLKFIGEYSFIYKKLIKVRFEKTDRMITFNYKGNPLNIVERSKNLYTGNYLITNNMIENIQNHLDEYPTDISLLDKIFDETKKFYYAENKTVTTLHSMLTNFIKTTEISFSLNPGINGKVYSKVLDVDAGRGGDINKLFFMNVQQVIATDPDSQALEIYRERYNLLKKNNKGSPFTLTTKVTSIIDDEFLNIKDNFDAINYQLAIHFYWEPKYKNIVAERLSKLAKIGAPLLITTNNGDKIKELLVGKEQLIFQLKDTLNFIITKQENNKIGVLYQTSNVGSVENLVFKDDLIETFKVFGFRLHEYYSFDEIMYNFEDNIEKFKSFNTTKKSANDMFRNIHNLYLSAKKNNKDPTSINILLSCFSVYRFYFKS